MSRIRFMSPYLKGGRDAAKLANRTRYVATRPGVEVLPEEHGDRPATKKQQEYICRLLRDFPDAQELLEYEDYQSNPTRETASVFIQQVREDFVEAMSQRENYLDYVAHRPGVELQGEHGLWGPGGKVQNLSQAIREVADHTGNVWTPVVAIRREDAERLGYDTAENWRALVNACLPDIAKGYKISPYHLRWYAAFHGKEQSVHIHMVVFSSDPKEGYLTKQGIQQVKSAFARRIFRDDLLHVYEQKTEYRASTQREARLAMEELIQQMRNGDRDNPHLEQLTTALALRLQTTKGKKVYGYLPPKTKAIVDEIVDELAKDERVAAAYDLWYQMQEEICRTYSEQPPRRVPLSQQKEFKAVRNMVIQEALRLSQTESISEDISQEQAEMPNAAEPSSTQLDGNQAETPREDDSIRPAAPECSKPSEQKKEPAVVAAVSRMFYHMGRIFEDRCMTDTMQRGIQIDRKRQRKLLEKKMAMGHKADDHENEEIQLIMIAMRGVSMGTFIYFTEEQKRQANEVDLAEFLRRQGEKLLPSGRDYRLDSDHSVTIRGNEWFDHETQTGGHAIDFVRTHYGMTFPEAVTMLLGGEQGQFYPQAREKTPPSSKTFALPPPNRDMRRVYAYLMKHRHINRDVITHFARAGVLYEDEKYHNVVFVGKDETGTARHAHKRSTNSTGKAFRQNVEGSDPKYSFHHFGRDGSLFVFEAPIDLLSYLTLYPEEWKDHSYVACCGTSPIPVLTMLQRMKTPQAVYLCLDNDRAGHEASLRMTEQIGEQFHIASDRLIPERKDWNDDLCVLREAPKQGMAMGMR